MKKVDFDIFDEELDDIDSDLAEMVRSLTFRNRPTYRNFRFTDEEHQHVRQKRNHRQKRHDDEIKYH